jgi:hypothetical protein
MEVSYGLQLRSQNQNRYFEIVGILDYFNEYLQSFNYRKLCFDLDGVLCYDVPEEFVMEKVY